MSALSSLLIISAIVIFVVFFRMTGGSVAWTYMGELSSPKRSAMGMAFHYFVSFGVGSVFPLL